MSNDFRDFREMQQTPNAQSQTLDELAKDDWRQNKLKEDIAWCKDNLVYLLDCHKAVQTPTTLNSVASEDQHWRKVIDSHAKAKVSEGLAKIYEALTSFRRYDELEIVRGKLIEFEIFFDKLIK